jgi:hypothetical protein
MNKSSRLKQIIDRHFFFAIETTSKTSIYDIEDFSELLEVICKRYNLKWCQTEWKTDIMKRIKEELDNSEVKNKKW